DLARDGGTHAIEGHRPWVATVLLADEICTTPLRPYRQLFDRRRTERICSHEHRSLARTDETRCELPNGRGLSDTVHADDHNDVRKPTVLRMRRGTPRYRSLEDTQDV